MGTQPTLPAAGTNRRVTVFGSVEALGRGRVEVVGVGQNSARFLEYLEVLGERHRRTGREIILVLDNGRCHTSKASRAALAERAGWLRPIWLARYSPHLNPKEREWRRLRSGTPARTWRTPCAGSWMASCGGWDAWEGNARRSWTRCPSGSSRGAVRRLPSGRRAGPGARRTRARESDTRGRTYQRILSMMVSISAVYKARLLQEHEKG